MISKLIPLILCCSICSSFTNGLPQVIRIGGIYPITNILNAKVNKNGAQWLAGSLMAMRDLNSDPQYIASNIEFKLAVRDSRKTFSNTVVGCLDLAQTVFKSSGSHVIVGAGFNPVTEAMAYVFSDPQNNLAQVAYASNISSVSHQSVFPDFLRTYPSSSYEGFALADTVSSYFKYTRVILIYTTGLYGTDGATEFLTAAVQMGIDVVHTVAFDPYESDFAAFLGGVSEYDARVFVLIMSNINQAGAMLLYASETGLINEKTVVFGTSSLASPAIWTSVTSDAAVAAKMMRGFFTTANADNDWKVTAKGLEFIRRYRAQPNTLGYNNSAGTHICNNATDDDGTYHLYKASLNNQAPYNCIGFNFSRFAADGSDIASYAPYAYDATIAAAMGVLSFAKSNNNGIVPHRINGLLLKLALIANVSFSGYSGKIEFSSGRPLISHYGVGDRTAGVRFIVYNFNPGGGSIYQYSLNRVGTWTTETGFQLCGSDPTLQSSVTGGCHDITYGTYGNARPEDRPSIVTPVMSLSIKATLFVLAAINFCLVMFFMAVLVKFRTTRLLKASQPSMTWIILTANLFSVCRIVLSAIDISSARCALDVWTGHLAFMSVVAMFAKTLRIFIIIKSGLRRIKVTAAQVLSFTGFWYSSLIIYLIFNTVFAPALVLDSISVAINGQATRNLSCTTSKPALQTVLYIWEGLFLGGSALLCYATKDVPDAINEAKVIALALIVIVVVCAVGFPLTMNLGLQETQQQLVIGLCFFIAGVGSMSFYFGQKAYLLLTGAVLNAQFKIVRKDLGDRSKTRGNMDRGQVSTSINSISQLPKNITECENQILVLQGHLMVLLEKAVNLGSRSESGGPRHTNNSVIAEELASKFENGEESVGNSPTAKNCPHSRNESDAEYPSEMPFNENPSRRRKSGRSKTGTTTYELKGQCREEVVTRVKENQQEQSGKLRDALQEIKDESNSKMQPL